MRCNKWSNSFLPLAWEKAFLSFPAFSIAFHEMQPHHCLFSPSSAIVHMGELANPTLSAASNPQLWITYSLVNLMKFVFFLSSIQFFMPLCLYEGEKTNINTTAALKPNMAAKPQQKSKSWRMGRACASTQVGVLIRGRNPAVHSPAKSRLSLAECLERLLPSEEVPSHSMLWDLVSGHCWMDYSCSTGGPLSPLRQSYRWCIYKTS